MGNGEKEVTPRSSGGAVRRSGPMVKVTDAGTSYVADFEQFSRLRTVRAAIDAMSSRSRGSAEPGADASKSREEVADL